MIPLRDNIESDSTPFVNYLLIAANVLVFFYQLNLETTGELDWFIRRFAVIPQFLEVNFFGTWHTLITSQFLHGGWMHLIGNMVYLFIFGDNVEDRFGHLGYLLLYLGFGIAAALTQAAFHWGSSVPMIGASGAIAGVLGAYFVFYPRAQVLALIPMGYLTRIVEIPAFFFLGFWFVMQTFSGTAALYVSRVSGQGGGVAWWAHAGGFLAGLLLALPFKFSRRRSWD